MAEDFSIRLIERRDIPALLALYRQLKPEGPLATIEHGETTLQTLDALSGSGIFGGFLDGHLVSTCALAVIPGLTHGGRPYAVIENVVTDAAHRQQGYGRAVIKSAIAAAWSANAYKVMLMTGSQRSETHRFYRESGFSPDKVAYQIRAATSD